MITIKSSETYEDLADLVEYLYAPPNGVSEWGTLRAKDGHVAPYNISWFEIGNEIKTPDFTGRVLAMEAAAMKLGKGGVIRYACPANCGDQAVINASLAGTPPLGERIYVDVHGGTSNLKAARGHVKNFAAAGSKARVVVWETNTARHGPCSLSLSCARALLTHHRRALHPNSNCLHFLWILTDRVLPACCFRLLACGSRRKRPQ